MNKKLLLALAIGCLATFLACRKQDSLKQHEGNNPKPQGKGDIKTPEPRFKKNRQNRGLKQDEDGEPRGFKVTRSEEDSCYYIEQEVKFGSGIGKLQLCCKRVDEEKLDGNTYPVVQLQPYPQLGGEAEEAKVYIWEDGKLLPKKRGSEPKLANSVKKRKNKNSRTVGSKEYVVVGIINMLQKGKTYEVVTLALELEKNQQLGDVVIPAAEVDSQGREEAGENKKNEGSAGAEQGGNVGAAQVDGDDGSSRDRAVTHDQRSAVGQGPADGEVNTVNVQPKEDSSQELKTPATGDQRSADGEVNTVNVQPKEDSSQELKTPATGDQRSAGGSDQVTGERVNKAKRREKSSNGNGGKDGRGRGNGSRSTKQ
ncbi:MAG: hypothetical protein MI674_04320 [Cytophagales bacterium]|nr:hypothetical protein [Cytophagales bacterium]